MKTEFLKKACDWFVTIKDPSFKEKVALGLSRIDEGKLPEDNWKKLFGFILFDYTMHAGPVYFMDSEEQAKEIGVLDEYKGYAESWINYSVNK